MLKSLTGYGASSGEYNGAIISIEIKGVNHKYLDISFKMPKIFNQWEIDFRNLVRERIKRGKVNIFINVENQGSLFKKLNFDLEIAKNYYDSLQKIADIFKINNDLSLKDFLLMKGVFDFKDEEVDEELKKFIENLLREAINNFEKMKIEEGAHLEKDIILRLEKIKNYLNEIDEKKDIIVEKYKEKLKKNIEKILNNGTEIDEKRLEFEIVLFSDKADITEEIVRLNSHIEKFIKTCKERPPVGKKLDFILQEMNREINTIGSKNNLSDISELVIETKNEIERIREQIQNIE